MVLIVALEWFGFAIAPNPSQLGVCPLPKKLFPSGRKVLQNPMKKSFMIYFLAAALLCLFSGISAKADTLTVTWGEVNGPDLFPGFFTGTIDAGAMPFTIPSGQTIVGAIFSSTLGNSNPLDFDGSTAVMTVDVNGVQVGSCPDKSSPCWIGTGSPIPFTYTFTSADLLALGSGTADLTITQTDCCVIRLGASTLVITTSPTTATPEPGSLALLGFGVLGLAALKLGKK